jgi:putative FmdB family regulatory protein
MPTYQYACTSCGERLEAVQKFSDDPLTECPACAGTLRKVFSAVGVVFKGSGFYKTDSRSRSGSKTGASSSSAADTSKSGSSAATSSGGSSETAPVASGSGGEKKSDNTDKVA